MVCNYCYQKKVLFLILAIIKFSRGKRGNNNNEKSSDYLAPTTYDQTIQTEQNKKIKISLKATTYNDDKIIFSISKYPSHGKLLSLNSVNGKVVYVPNTGFTGHDEFTFKATGLGGNPSNESQVLIKVNDINHAQALSDGNKFNQPIDNKTQNTISDTS